MLPRTAMSKPVRVALVITAGLGAAHFLVSISFWMFGLALAWQLTTAQPDWMYFCNALPAAVFFGVFAEAFRLAWRCRRSAVVLVILATVASAGLCVYDMRNDRYDLQVLTLEHGCKHYYFTWWAWQYDG